MDYYSPVLRRRAIRDALAGLEHVEAELAVELKKFFRRVDALFRELDRRGGDEYSQVESETRGDAEKFLIPSPRPFFDEMRPVAGRLAVRYFLDKVSSGLAIENDPIEEAFRELGQFSAVLAMDGEEFAHVYDTTGGRSLKVVCKDASRFLGERMEGFHSVVAMSATLGPVEFYRDMLGLDAGRTDVVELPSPFPRENREILVVSDVLTTFRHRAGGYDRIAEVIEETVSARAGNYMALFPSYEFLRGVREVLGERALVGAELIVQEPRMTAVQREELLAALGRGGVGSRLVLAVQGGIFAEGVDYAGDLLSGVVVVSPALPQVSFERDLMREYYDQKYGNGFDYAYVFPGMSRVIQSVGRLIRTETDRGVAVLVCRRFAQAQYARLFPSDWGAVKLVGGRRGDVVSRLREFWGR
jgi:DNA excision repair protein ERCC-2